MSVANQMAFIKAYATEKYVCLLYTSEGPVMQMWTISALQMHEKGIIVCDDAATEELKVRCV